MNAKKPTKTQLKQEAEQLRTTAIHLMGRIAWGDGEAMRDLWEMGRNLMGEVTAGNTDFGGLLEEWKHGYRPTVRIDQNPKFVVFADIYDFFQARTGRPEAVAYRAS